MGKATYWIGLAGVAWAIAWGPTELLAGSCRLESAEHRVTVLELYTSEGCNSCPPADRWLSGLPGRGYRLTERSCSRSTSTIGTSWAGRIGFPSPPTARASARWQQRASSGVVYTPQIVLDGRALPPDVHLRSVEARLNAINREKGHGLDLGRCHELPPARYG